MSPLRRWTVPAMLVGLGAVVVSLAPPERTLREGIRRVYAHVSLIVETIHDVRSRVGFVLEHL